jgi:hypothetical protein
MLACQLMMAAMSAIRRFDSVVLHSWSSLRETLANLRFCKTGDETEW